MVIKERRGKDKAKTRERKERGQRVMDTMKEGENERGRWRMTTRGRNKGVKRLKKKELRLRAKPSAPTPAVDALIGDEELTGEKRREKIERNRE